jgi:hypothetical protein
MGAMSDESPKRAEPVPVGSDYRVKRTHPRRGGSLVITDKTGKVIATSGQVCDDVATEHLVSMIRNGYVERVDETPEPVEEPVPSQSPIKPSRRVTDKGGR